MAEINFSVPADKLPRIMEAMEGVYPIPTDAEGVPLFTGGQWAKEAVRRFVIRTVLRWERKVAVDMAAETISEDNDLLS